MTIRPRARGARAVCPDLRVVLLSGLGEHSRVRSLERGKDIDRVMGKPITVEELLEVLRELGPRGLGPREPRE